MFQQHDDLQTVISGYTLVDFIGGGQFGKVYKAIKKDSQTIYAVKVVRKFIPNIDAQRRAKLRLLLETEIRAMQLCNSDNVVRIVERLETPSKIYIVMEYCDGPDLQNYLKQHGILQEKDALMIVRQLACGFQELQRNNIIHRDLKPANIFSSGGNFKIGDLGFARVLQKNEDLTTTLLGSLCYMAPEILTYKKYGFLVDIWSLGVILHMMVTGRRPFGTPHISNFAQMHDAIKNTELSFHNCKISKELEGLLRGMLTIDPAERMQWEAFYSHPLLAEEQNLLVSIEFPLLRRDASKDKHQNNRLTELAHKDFLEKIVEQEKDHTDDSKDQNEDILPSSLKQDQMDKVDDHYRQIQEMGREFSQYTEKLLAELGKLNLLLKYLVVLEDRAWSQFVEESRKLTELRLLIAERCMKKAEMIKKFFDKKDSIFQFKLIQQYRNSLQYINIEAEHRFIYQKCKRYYDLTSLNLKVFEDKKRNIIRDFVRRYSDHENYQQKEKFISAIENVDYTLEEHTKFVIKYANSIKQRWRNMKPCRALYQSLLVLTNYEALAGYGGDPSVVKKATKEVLEADKLYRTEGQWKQLIDKTTSAI